MEEIITKVQFIYLQVKIKIYIKMSTIIKDRRYNCFRKYKYACEFNILSSEL